MSDRLTAEEAGYMELDGAKKDADCHIVRVRGGISSGKGCCNKFHPKTGADHFRCGECRHVDRNDLIRVH